MGAGTVPPIAEDVVWEDCPHCGESRAHYSGKEVKPCQHVCWQGTLCEELPRIRKLLVSILEELVVHQRKRV